MTLSKMRISALLVILLSFNRYFAAQSYSDAALLSEGSQAYQRDQCVQAAKFFFAYLLRNPSTGRADLQQAINWCEKNTTVYAGGKGDDPLMRPRPAKPPLSNISAGNGATVGPPTARRQSSPRCDIYTSIAIAQNQANISHSCGYTGARWDSVYQNHYDRCTAVGREEARAETQERQRLLDQCAP